MNSTTSVIDLDRSATKLGVSPLTVRNWIRHGYIEPVQLRPIFFNASDIENLKQKIISGELKRLKKRANKSGSEHSFIPEEYLEKKEYFKLLQEISSYIRESNLDLNESLFFLALNLLSKEGLLESPRISDSLQHLQSKNRQLSIELNNWLETLTCKSVENRHLFLLDTEIPLQKDFLGLIYQSVMMEGAKAKSGSYYTPIEIIKNIVSDYSAADAKILDPCCGTGQFLLCFSEKIKDPTQLFGYDIDEISVRIARINLLIQYKNLNFTPNIYHKNTLLEKKELSLFESANNVDSDFDIIATNPPWGLHFKDEEKIELAALYPQLTSLESFSYFLNVGLSLLKENGILSFILPESILNVKTHADIRKMILEGYSIERILYLDRVFQNVFTPVIRLDIKKKKNIEQIVEIIRNKQSHQISQSRFLGNYNYCFDIHLKNNDAEILEKVYGVNHVTLKGNAEWALGIVTGNNEEHLSDNKKDGFEEIYKGKDIVQFGLKNPSNYIKFIPEKFQQVAPTHKYRASEKLIYKFISNKLVFALDNKQRLTLNSANIVIPKLNNYPNKVILALFNSSLYQFIFQKKFSSIKVLRGHLEELPLPLWDRDVFQKIERQVDKIHAGEKIEQELDRTISKIFGLSEEEDQYILSSIS